MNEAVFLIQRRFYPTSLRKSRYLGTGCQFEESVGHLSNHRSGWRRCKESPNNAPKGYAHNETSCKPELLSR